MRRGLKTVVPLVVWTGVLVACSGASEDSTPGDATRPEAMCSAQCSKGAACGFLDGCVSVAECHDSCVQQFASEEMSGECLDAIEAFISCFWPNLSCDEILASAGAGICAGELDAIGPPCSAGKQGFDKDRYVYVPLFCVYGPG